MYKIYVNGVFRRDVSTKAELRKCINELITAGHKVVSFIKQ